jgi:hypothetical protein
MTLQIMASDEVIKSPSLLTQSLSLSLFLSHSSYFLRQPGGGVSVHEASGRLLPQSRHRTQAPADNQSATSVGKIPFCWVHFVQLLHCLFKMIYYQIVAKMYCK